MTGFAMFRPFDIDDGELDTLTPQECFVLGYELCQVDHLLKAPGGVNQKPVHAHNRERIAKACEESGREYLLNWAHEDPSEEWMYLSIREV